MNQPVRIYPGGIVDVHKYQFEGQQEILRNLAICGTATATSCLPFVATASSQRPWYKSEKQCYGCGARKESFLNGQTVCAYCKNPK